MPSLEKSHLLGHITVSRKHRKGDRWKAGQSHSGRQDKKERGYVGQVSAKFSSGSGSSRPEEAALGVSGRFLVGGTPNMGGGHLSLGDAMQ